jgi:hypothetical protein
MPMRANALSVLALLSVLAGFGLAAQPPAPAEKPSSAAASDGSAPQDPKGLQAAPKWPVSFVDTALPPTRVSTPNELAFTLLVGNASADKQDVAVDVALRSSSGSRVQTTVSCDEHNNQATESGKSKSEKGCVAILPADGPIVPVTIKVALPETPRDAYPLNGVVVLRPNGKGPWNEAQPRATLAISAIGLDSAPAQDWTIVAGAAWYALIAVLLGGVGCLALWGRWSFFTRMGSATFSFSDSWSGALMIAGPLLTAFLTTFTAFPEHAHTMSKRSYLLLSLLLSALIALGPALFNLLKLPTRVSNADGSETTQSQGLVVFFFLAAAVALTGGFGQLTLLGFVVRDLTSAAFVSPPLGAALVKASDALFWLVFLASIASMVTTVAAATAHPAPEDEAGGTLQRAADSLQHAVNAKPESPKAGSLPSWSLP